MPSALRLLVHKEVMEIAKEKHFVLLGAVTFAGTYQLGTIYKFWIINNALEIFPKYSRRLSISILSSMLVRSGR